MSFGWSAGDISMAIAIIIKTVKALDEANGAANEYRETISFLQNLHDTLDKLLVFSRKEKEDQLENRLQLRNQVEAMKPKVMEFLIYINKRYEDSLGTRQPGAGKKKSYTINCVKGKLEWAVFTSAKVKALKEAVVLNMQNIDRLVQLYVSILEASLSS